MPGQQKIAQLSGPLHAQVLVEGKERWDILAKKEGTEEDRVGLWGKGGISYSKSCLVAFLSDYVVGRLV